MFIDVSYKFPAYIDKVSAYLLITRRQETVSGGHTKISLKDSVFLTSIFKEIAVSISVMGNIVLDMNSVGAMNSYTSAVNLE